MSEEEIIEELKVLIGLEEFNKLTYKENRAIQGLLDLYQKEKEKNKEIQNINFRVNKNLLEVAEQLEQEKKKNKELEDTLKHTQNSWYEDTKIIENYKQNYISKDKIREKIEELQKEYCPMCCECDMCERIEELLEEKKNDM